MEEKKGVVLLGEQKQVWCVVGKPKGTHGHARVFLKSFGMKDSLEDALNAVAHKAKTNPRWASSYSSWQFVAARIDLYLELDAQGALIVRYRNDEGLW